MGTPLKNPPVYFTLAQVRFNSLLKLKEYLPTIQDEMRKAGFPDFAAKTTIILEVTVEDGKSFPTPKPNETFFFGTTDKKHSFVLGEAFLTLQSTKYGTFEDFSAMFVEGLRLVNQVVQLDFIERIGLRYLDNVTPKAGEAVYAYLAPEVHGLSGFLGGQPQHSYTETVNTVNEVSLVSRVLIQHGGIAFPPDVQPEQMELEQRFLDCTGHHAMLDNDGFVVQREVFSIEYVERQLSSIHKVIGKAFRATATEYAFNVWNEQ